MGEWSDPIEGRDSESHEGKVGKINVLVKARSMALGLWVPWKGKQVSTPRVLRRVKPRSYDLLLSIVRCPEGDTAIL